MIGSRTIYVGLKISTTFQTFQELYVYSINHRSAFWAHALEFLNIIYYGAYTKVVDENARMSSIPRWFEGITLNFAENLMYRRTKDDAHSRRGTIGKEDSKTAITEVREGGSETRNITWNELRTDVCQLATAMRQWGLGKGDRIAVVASNSYDTLKVFLAGASLGCIFSSSSTDMGTPGILDRLNQIEPKVRSIMREMRAGPETFH